MLSELIRNKERINIKGDGEIISASCPCFRQVSYILNPPPRRHRYKSNQEKDSERGRYKCDLGEQRPEDCKGYRQSRS